MEAAIDKLEALLQKTDSDLNYISLRLDSEFSQQYAKKGEMQLNPVKLMERIKKAKEEFCKLQLEVMEIDKGEKEVQEELYSNLIPSQQIMQMLQQQTGLQVAVKTDEEQYLRSVAPANRKYDNQDNGLSSNHNEGVEEGIKENTTASSSQSTETHISTEIKRNLKEFVPVTDTEFNSVSSLVRGRVKLDDVNKVHEALFDHFKKNKKSLPLTPQDMTKMGLKITGATGGAKLKVLRALKIIQLTKKGAAQWQM